MIGWTTDEPGCETVLDASDAEFDWPGFKRAFEAAAPDEEVEPFALLVHTPFLHISYVHFPLAHAYDEKECDELGEDEEFLQLEPMHCTPCDSGCIPDELDCEKDLEAPEVK